MDKGIYKKVVLKMLIFVVKGHLGHNIGLWNI